MTLRELIAQATTLATAHPEALDARIGAFCSGFSFAAYDVMAFSDWNPAIGAVILEVDMEDTLVSEEDLNVDEEI